MADGAVRESGDREPFQLFLREIDGLLDRDDHILTAEVFRKFL